MSTSVRRNFNVEDYIPTEEMFTDCSNRPQLQKQQDNIDEQLRQKLTIAFVGTANSGKSSGIKCLFGVDPGSIHPIPGATPEVKIFSMGENVLIIDTPGFGDVNKEVSQKAYDICKHVDVFIYVLNAQVGYMDQEKEDYGRISEFARDSLVVFNKIDTVNPEEKQERIERARSEMGIAPENFIDAAFDPIPQVSSSPINDDKIVDWISEKLELRGKDFLFAKATKEKYRDESCDKYILGACVTAAAIGALPIPGSDIAGLTVLQTGLLTKIANIYGRKIDKRDALHFIAQTCVGQAGKQVYRLMLSSLKAVGWFPGAQIEFIVVAPLAATIAASMTYGLGNAGKAYYKSGQEMSWEKILDLFKGGYEEYYSMAKKDGGMMSR